MVVTEMVVVLIGAASRHPTDWKLAFNGNDEGERRRFIY